MIVHDLIFLHSRLLLRATSVRHGGWRVAESHTASFPAVGSLVAGLMVSESRKYKYVHITNLVVMLAPTIHDEYVRPHHLALAATRSHRLGGRCVRRHVDEDSPPAHQRHTASRPRGGHFVIDRLPHHGPCDGRSARFRRLPKCAPLDPMGSI